MATNNSVLVKFLADTTQMRKALGEIDSKLTKFGKVAVAAGAAIAGAFVAGKVAQVGKEAVEAASNLEQAAGATLALFGPETQAQMSSWATTAATSLGLSKQEALEAANKFAISGKQMGLGAQELASYSQDLTATAADLAAQFGGSTAEAVNALGAAFRGEADPAERYGLSLKQSAIDAEAASLGFQKVDGAFTQADKNAAMVSLIEKQSQVNGALGAFGREADTFAGSSQRLQATFDNLKASLGEGLLPALTELSQVLLPVVEDLGPVLGQLGKDIGEALGPALKELSAVVAPLGKALGSVAGVMGGVLSSVIKALAPIVVQLASKFAAFVDRLAPTLVPFINKLGDLLGKLADALMPVVDVALDLVATLAEALAPILDVVIDVLVILVDSIAPVIKALGSIIKALSPVIAAFGQLLADILRPLIPIITLQARIMGVLLVKALGYLAIAVGYGMKAWGEWGKTLTKVVGPVVEKVLGFLADLVEGMSWMPFIGDEFAASAAGLRSSASSITSSLTSYATSVASAGDGVIAAGQDILAGTNEIAEAAQENFGDILTPNATTTKKAAAANEAAGEETTQALGKGAAKGKEKAKSQVVDSIKDILKAAEDIAREWRNRVVGWMDIGKAFDLANDSKARLEDLNEQLGELRATPDYDKEAEAKLLAQIDEAGREAGKTWAQRFADQVAAGADFARQLGDLKKSGLNEVLLAQVAEMGPENGALLATELLNDKTGLIGTLNAQSATLTQAGTDLGVLMANEAPLGGEKFGLSFIGDPKTGGLLFTIDKEKKKVRRQIRKALNTEVEVKVRYVADYSAAGAAYSGTNPVAQLQNYEALNGRRWRL